MSNVFFDQQTIEKVTKALVDYTTGSKIGYMLESLNLKDIATPEVPTPTKWVRLADAVIHDQNKTQTGKSLIAIIEWIMKPSNFIDQERSIWQNALISLNQVLQYSGLKLEDNGKVVFSKKVETYSEGKTRYHSLTNTLKELEVHNRLLVACTPEILQENYFHLILESSKIVLQSLREISELTLDGNKLVNESFQGNNPRVIMNTLQTLPERSVHYGLMALLNEIVYLYRNPAAHEPKIYSPASEVDAISAMITMSKALKLLEKCALNTTAIKN